MRTEAKKICKISFSLIARNMSVSFFEFIDMIRNQSCAINFFMVFLNLTYPMLHA